MQDNANFIVAIILSAMILMGFHYFYEVPRQKAVSTRAQATSILKNDSAAAQTVLRKRDEVLQESGRVTLGNARIHGSINLKGGRFDDVTLIHYRETIETASPEIVLLSPAGIVPPPLPYYAEFGWIAQEPGVKVPGADTLWKTDRAALAAGETVILSWDNGEGLTFERHVTLDENYVFKITQKVRNTGVRAVTLFPYGLISRHGMPTTMGYAILHEGPLGVIDGTLREHSYGKLKDEGLVTQETSGGWIGMTDVYWLASLVAPKDEKMTTRFIHSTVAEKDRFQVDLQGAAVTLAPGAEAMRQMHLFTGAKEVKQLDAYAKELDAPMFDRAIDFGWFYVIAKPFFHVIDFFYRFLGNYGLAILAFTVLLRGAFYPMQEATYRNMAKMKELQPEINAIKERHGSDALKMNEEMTKIYKREKLNPLAGCLPILVQIPVFFALYKVLLVSIEMRHTPFYGWIRDLSAPDPSNLFTLFSLVPWTPPDWLHVGIYPILMGVTMFIQQKLSPPPADKTTYRVFMMLPLLFTFLLAKMAAGLVIYWTFSNVLAIAQQVLIKHRTTPARAKK